MKRPVSKVSGTISDMRIAGCQIDGAAHMFTFVPMAGYHGYILDLILSIAYIRGVSANEPTVSDQLRSAIDDSDRHGMSRYRICMNVGLDESTMSRFMRGKGGLSIHTIDAIALLLDLELVQNEPGRGKR